jgi:ketosteroid isomerase-like protein
MKLGSARCAFVLVLLLAPAAAYGQASLPAAGTADVTAEIARVLRERFEAYGRADAEAWGRFVADDCVCGLSTKQTLQQEMRARPAGVRLSIGEVTDLEVRVHGDAAAVRYRSSDVTQIGEQRVAVALIKAETYVRRDGRWLLLGGAETIVPADPPVAVVDPRRYDALVGRYEYGAGVVDVVTRQGSRLMVQATGQGPEELVPESATTFFLKGQPWRYVFVVKGGSAASLIFRMYGHDLVATRIGR